MKYKLVIFDFDGTLADSMPWFLDIVDGVADRYSFKRVDRAEIDRLRALSARKLIEIHGIPLWKLPRITMHLRQLADRDSHLIPLFEGVREVLMDLASRGVTLAVVTSNTEANVRKILGPELSSLIRYYQCGASMFGKKSKFRKVLQQAGVHPREVLSIGDEIRDMDAAAAYDIPFGAVAWGYTRIDALAARSPVEVFHRMTDIVERVA
ncbi:phosphoglycolate phosphatase [Pseudoxanthobacter soli DSM 19599]|uniref:Phosphoglycolate phosphatase n=1 Tax=Pseudoxanthobacter soli DSM 19599 TaxID=1123029 RepID=A0A1M7ZPU1_9HYPH|nr:HAD hydrolase-like protein [Pseudoxanthobacter soli]SHO66923.1 phosphoglycolate phosphatase [Pseudoxanthobacter soli DSM 19599]